VGNFFKNKFVQKINALFVFDTWSLKKLTLLGFTLVALPLVCALLYSAQQVNRLSLQSERAILNTAQLIEVNKLLGSSVNNMERFASQYLVLKEQELHLSYQQQHNKVIELLQEHFVQSDDRQLKQVSARFHQQLLEIEILLSSEAIVQLTFSQLQSRFKKIAGSNQLLNLRINELVNMQAQAIKRSTVAVRQTLLKSLLIIPITLAIAIFFIVVITKPLKQLTTKIQRLEQGDFKDKIELKSSPEVNEIVEALEVMRIRLHALELQKSSFIRHISHELKTPLAAIREGSELLYDNSVGQLNEAQQEISDIIRHSVNRLQRLIEDLLNFNIVLDSTSLQDSELLDVAEIIDGVIAERKLDLKRKNLTIAKQVDDALITGNAKQLSVVIDNLLSNAIKYSPYQGEININSQHIADELHFSLADQGTGIIAEQLDHIFDAFYQGKPPIDSLIKGSGLGLTIVKELVMRMSGSIVVKCAGENKTNNDYGTTVLVTLPRVQNKRNSNEILSKH